jgi:hypothetical protein
LGGCRAGLEEGLLCGNHGLSGELEVNLLRGVVAAVVVTRVLLTTIVRGAAAVPVQV